MAILFYILFFFTPLIMWPYTSEIFEFNKMIFVYLVTALILAAWIIKSIRQEKIIFRKTILDIPILVFITSQLISTLLSIDPRTSLLGYYSRFNGGLVSTICYSILYWAFVSNLKIKDAKNSIFYLIASSIFVSIYGVLQHFGIDKDIWVQDVQNRIFSTLGQPNWLAAMMVGIIPIAIYLHLPCSSQFTKNKFKNIFYFALLSLLFTTLMYTKSRSGLLGFGVASVVFWLFDYYKNRFKNVKYFLIINSIFILIFAISSFTPKIPTINTPVAPALESGGTESGQIRKIVWQGAADIWKAYPIFGSGVETFAYIYPQFRPAAHNLVSEWDFIYNKAHNEYLNIAATTGSIGLISYLVFIGASLFLLAKLQRYDLLSGSISILVTNFFGFSVVVTQLFLFLFPALAVISSLKEEETLKEKKLDQAKWILIITTLIPTVYIINAIYNYFNADVNYNYAKQYNEQAKPKDAIDLLKESISTLPKEPLYKIEIAKSYSLLNMPIEAVDFAKSAIQLSPSNVTLKKVLYTVYVRLVASDTKYLLPAQRILEEAIVQAPTDAKLFYNLGVTLWRKGDLEKADKILAKALELKPNYKEGRFAYALLLEDLEKPELAKIQLEYILQNIDPNDELTKDELSKLQI